MPSLGGYNAAKGLVRQFVATPPGSEHSAESQLNGRTEHGGLQIAVYQMKADVYAEYCHKRAELDASNEQSRIRFGVDTRRQVELTAGGMIRQQMTADPTASMPGTKSTSAAVSCICSTPNITKRSPASTRRINLSVSWITPRWACPGFTATTARPWRCRTAREGQQCRRRHRRANRPADAGQRTVGAAAGADDRREAGTSGAVLGRGRALF